MVMVEPTAWFVARLLVLTCLTTRVAGVAAPLDDLLEYNVRALMSSSKLGNKVLQPCSRSLFSPERFEIKGETKLLDDFGCTTIPFVDIPTIGVAKRGKCSFEQKARAAVDSGLVGIVIINLDKTAFPVGATDHLYRSPIPVVMVGNMSLDENLLSQGHPVSIHLMDQGNHSYPFIIYQFNIFFCYSII